MSARVQESTEIVLREATPDDLDAVAEIERRTFSDPWSRSSFQTVIGQPLMRFTVATLGEKVVGYVVAWFIGGEGEIGNIAVAPEDRGKGIGSRLLEHALEAAREFDVNVIYLEVRESNVAAQRLYARRGFTRVGRRRRYYRKPEEDALILRLESRPHTGG
jgi:ribosomal-protein-alanine N-acetyltransferase